MYLYNCETRCLNTDVESDAEHVYQSGIETGYLPELNVPTDKM